MTTLAAPMTIEQFDNAGLPENYELHHGEPIEMSVAGNRHRFRQKQIEHLLEEAFPDAVVVIEYGFVVGETHDKRSADVGMTTWERSDASEEKDILIGAPELVVEVLSPSNTFLDVTEYRELCFNHGTLVFWAVDFFHKRVEAYLKDGTYRNWIIGQEIPLTLWGETKRIAVSAIFTDRRPSKRKPESA